MNERPVLEPIFAESIAAAEADEGQVLRDIADMAEKEFPQR